MLAASSLDISARRQRRVAEFPLFLRFSSAGLAPPAVPRTVQRRTHRSASKPRDRNRWPPVRTGPTPSKSLLGTRLRVSRHPLARRTGIAKCARKQISGLDAAPPLSLRPTEVPMQAAASRSSHPPHQVTVYNLTTLARVSATCMCACMLLRSPPHYLQPRIKHESARTARACSPAPWGATSRGSPRLGGRSSRRT